jgi:hypothetical protein
MILGAWCLGAFVVKVLLQFSSRAVVN